MQDQVNQLKMQIEDMQKRLVDLERAENPSFVSFLDDALVEKVFNTQTSGTPATNDLLREITIGLNTYTVLDYPSRIMIFKWKGQRLAIPVYNASNIIYP